MKNRKGIILLMFDLPATTVDDRNSYYHFKKNLRKQGFLQLQESCYLKLIRNIDAVDQYIANLERMMPANGKVSASPLSLGKFRGMKCLLGESFDMALFTEDLYCIGAEENDIT